MLDNIFKNRKAMGTGFGFIYGIIFIFLLGLLFLIFNQVFLNHFNPVIETQINSSVLQGRINESQANVIRADNNKYMAFWNITPYVVFFGILFFIIVNAVRSNRQDEYL